MIKKNLFKTAVITMSVFTLALGMTGCGSKKASDNTDTQPMKESIAVVQEQTTKKEAETKASEENKTDESKSEDETKNSEDADATVNKESNEGNNIESGENYIAENSGVVVAENTDNGTADNSGTNNDSSDNSSDNTANTPDDNNSGTDTPVPAPAEPETEAPTEAPTTARATKTVTKKVIYYEQDNVTVFDTDSITYTVYEDTGLPVTPTYYTGDAKRCQQDGMPKCSIPDHMNIYWMKTDQSVHQVPGVNDDKIYWPEDGLDVTEYSGDIKLYPGWI